MFYYLKRGDLPKDTKETLLPRRNSFSARYGSLHLTFGKFKTSS